MRHLVVAIARVVILALAAAVAGPVASMAVASEPVMEPSAAPGSLSAAPGLVLLEPLERVPDTMAARIAPIGFVDYRAVEAARAGAARPDTFAAYEALAASGDPAADAWMAAMLGVASGSSDLLRGLLRHGGAWPEVLGLDFFDIDRQIEFGSPPSLGLALFGDFDPQAVGAALGRRGYEAEARGERTLWCAPSGCVAGMEPSLSDRDPADPFGGDLGQKRPLAVSSSDLLVSADIEVLEAMLAASDGIVGSLADHPAYRALAGAAAGDRLLLQATLLGAGPPGIDPSMYAALGGSPEAATALLHELESVFQPMPPWEAAAILDGATGSEQLVSVVLAYADAGDAAAASGVLERRLARLPSLARQVPIADLLADAGVTSITASAIPSGDRAAAAAVVELRAPLAGPEPEPGNDRPVPSSSLYGLLVRMLRERDALWLAPVLPLE